MSVLPERFDYRPRVVDDEVERRLRVMPTVLVEGSRGCGKTTTARRLANRELLLDQDANALSHAAHGTLPLDQGPFPLLIDEWQLAPQIWNRVRRASDDLQSPGRFILTGSANPTDDITRHSGAGRVARVRMRPMSLYESGASTGGREPGLPARRRRLLGLAAGRWAGRRRVEAGHRGSVPWRMGRPAAPCRWGATPRSSWASIWRRSAASTCPG